MSMPKKAPTEETLPEPIGQRRPTHERFRLRDINLLYLSSGALLVLFTWKYTVFAVDQLNAELIPTVPGQEAAAIAALEFDGDDPVLLLGGIAVNVLGHAGSRLWPRVPGFRFPAQDLPPFRSFAKFPFQFVGQPPISTGELTGSPLL